MSDHPWANFLRARLDVIKYFTQQGHSDELIANELSMTEEQVKEIKLSCLTNALFPKGSHGDFVDSSI